MVVGYHVRNLSFIHSTDHLFIVSEFLKAVVQFETGPYFLYPVLNSPSCPPCIVVLVYKLQVTPFQNECVK